MTTPLRFALSLLCATGLVHGQGAATVPPSPGGAEVSTAELSALFAGLPIWGASAIVESSIGYNDNLLFSASAQERSAFVRGSVSLLVLRAPTGALEASFSLQADGTRFFSGEAARSETIVWTQADFGYRFGKVLKISAPVTGYFKDQVTDVSSTSVERLVSKLKLTGGMVGPLVRLDLHSHWWLEAQATGERKRYDDHAFDARLGEAALRVAWKPTGRVEARLSGTERWWKYDTHTQYTAAGRALAGTILKIAEREGQARLNVAWDRAKHWRTDTRLTFFDYRDNGSGYFNYRGKKISHELQWENAAWLIRLEGTARRYDFDVRTVGFGINPPPRIKDEFTAVLRVERTLTKRWTTFGGFTWERGRSNDAFASYRANEGLLGLRWSWDK